MAPLLAKRATDGRRDWRIRARAAAGNIPVSFVTSFSMIPVRCRQVPREHIPLKAPLLVYIFKLGEYKVTILLTTQWSARVRRDFLLVGRAAAKHTYGVIVWAFIEIGIKLRSDLPLFAGHLTIIDISDNFVVEWVCHNSFRIQFFFRGFRSVRAELHACMDGHVGGYESKIYWKAYPDKYLTISIL